MANPSATDADDTTVEIRENSLADAVHELGARLDEARDGYFASLSDERLAELREELKALEEVTEHVRKGQADDEIKKRTPPGDSFQGLNHIQSHRKFVQEDMETVIGRAIRRGIDYTEFVSIDASEMDEVPDEVATVGRHEYSYLR